MSGQKIQIDGLIVELGQMEGRYFTQWRIDMLLELLQDVVYCYGETPLIEISNIKIWYDYPNDFHMLSYDAGNGSHIEVKLYKVFSSKIDGKDRWIGCPRSYLTYFANHLREASKQAD